MQVDGMPKASFADARACRYGCGLFASRSRARSARGLRAWRRHVVVQHGAPSRLDRAPGSAPGGSVRAGRGAGVGQYRICSTIATIAPRIALEPATTGHYTPLDYQSDITAIPVPDASFVVVLYRGARARRSQSRRSSRWPVSPARWRAAVSAPLTSSTRSHITYGGAPHWACARFLPTAGRQVRSIEATAGSSLRRSPALHWLGAQRTRGGSAWAIRASDAGGSRRSRRRNCCPTGPVSCRWDLERIATAGYHVVAVKQAVRANMASLRCWSSRAIGTPICASVLRPLLAALAGLPWPVLGTTSRPTTILAF